MRYFLALLFLWLSIPCVCHAQLATTDAVYKQDKAEYQNPRVYELMQVAMALTSKSQPMYQTIMDTSSAYYAEVMQHFGPFAGHKLVQKLNKKLAKRQVNYLYNLQQAYNSSSPATQARKVKHFPWVHRAPSALHSVGRKHMRSFARATGFDDFYSGHLPLYTQQLQQAATAAQVPQQQAWLEKEFTARYARYQLVMSPLMGGFHFTKRYRNKQGSQCAMWVPPPQARALQADSAYAARYAGVVMTEIDHNYVNPVSDKYKKSLNAAMGGSHRQRWAKGGVTQTYGTGYNVFNEYMTHAVYLLFVHDNYSAAIAAAANEARIRLMEQRRGFVQFGAFYQQLQSLYAQRPAGSTVTHLYPAMLQWVQAQNAAL